MPAAPPSVEDELWREGERWMAGGEDRPEVVRRPPCGPGDLSSSTELPRSELPLPPPDILRNFFRNCILVGLKGGDVADRLAAIGNPDVDSKEYCLDSIEVCLGEYVLR